MCPSRSPSYGEASVKDAAKYPKVVESESRYLVLFNAVRNNRSLAHDNPMLNYNESVVLLATLLFLWMVFRKERALEYSEHGSESLVLGGLSRFASRFACGLRDIGASYRLYLAALLSGSMLACQALALWFMMLACRIDLPLGACIVVLLVVRLGTALPNAPANVGSFQFFSVLALSLFGVEKTVAAGFSIIYFLALTVPLWIIGLLAISRNGISLSTIRLGASALRRDAGGA
jgi:uncharacterized membrane protein YbhN (UPF0104 family)